MHLRHLIVLIISARNKPAPLEKAGPSSDQERKPHPKGHGHLIGQIKKNQISRAMLSLSGVRIKQAAAHLFTMSIDPAADASKAARSQTCSHSRRYQQPQRKMVEPDGIEPTT